MATLKDFDEEERTALIECVYALHDNTAGSIVDIMSDTGLSRNSVRG